MVIFEVMWEVVFYLKNCLVELLELMSSCTAWFDSGLGNDGDGDNVGGDKKWL